MYSYSTNARDLHASDATAVHQMYSNEEFPPPRPFPVDQWRQDAWRKRRVFAAEKKRQKRKRIKIIVFLVILLAAFLAATFAMIAGIHAITGPLFSDETTKRDEPSAIKVQDITSPAALELVSVAKTSIEGNPFGFNNQHAQCLAFVDDVFSAYGQEFGRTCCATSAMRLSEPISYDCSIIPVGACIFSDKSVTHTMCTTCGRDGGHVGIYIGDNQVIHNGLNGIEIIDINDFIDQWGPNGSGGTIGWGPHMGHTLQAPDISS